MASMVVRAAHPNDLEPLIALYAAVGFSMPVAGPRRAKIWADMLAADTMLVAVVVEADAVFATATLVTAPNLLHDGRHHAFLENVATHPDRQGRGYGRAVVDHVLATAWAADCHHVLMQSGRADPRVHRFYERLGFMPGVRTGYVAVRPT